MNRFRRIARRRFGIPVWGLALGVVGLIAIGSASGTASRSSELDDAKEEASSARRQLDVAKGQVDALNRKVNELAATPATTRPAATSVPTTIRATTSTTQAGPRTSFAGSGVYRVGTDIAPGTYRSEGPSGSGTCYWERQSEFGASGISGIIANGNERGPAVITVRESDVGLRVSGCSRWEKVE